MCLFLRRLLLMTAHTSCYIVNVPLEGRAFTWQVTIHDSGHDIT